MKKFFKRLWEGWKKIAHAIGRFNTRIILTVFYFLVGGIAAFFMKLSSADPLKRRKVAGSSYWTDHDPQDNPLEQAKRQF